ncbi:right-handed parallel beta-helix repeat-containing protein [Dankookia sp. P2]|uniref:right-handed parallel beta-helix repeat-containing protein n=1 Tax=Dankookia sp. P2 TaxID=3423955 RepID=UPI003D67AF3B
MDASSISSNAGTTSTDYAAPANAVRISAGADIQSAVNSHPNGTAFLLSAGTYYGQTIRPKDGDSFYGENHATILDGNGAQRAFDGQPVSNVTISGLKITDYAPNNPGTGALGTDGSSVNWTVAGNEFYGIRSSVPIMLGTNMTVKDNYIHDNEMAGIGAYNTRGSVVEHNELANNNQSHNGPFTATGSGAGIKVFTVSDVTIANNYVHDNVTSPGIWVDGGSKSTTIENNWVANNDAPGVLVELDYGASVRGNLIEGNNDPSFQGFEGGGVYVQNSSNTEVADNILRGNVGGVWVFEENRGSGAQGPYVVSNDSVHGNTIQLSAGDNGMGGTVQNGDVRWYDNDYYLSGSASLIAGGGTKSVSQWQGSGLDTSSSGSTFNSGSLPTNTSTGSTSQGGAVAPEQTSSSGSTAAVVQTIGSGSDELVLKLSQDYFQGNAQYTVAVDGKQVGGTLTAGALSGSGQEDVLTVKGDWASGSHTLTVAFINDRFENTPGSDRNLHIDQVRFEGTDLGSGYDVLYSNGHLDFSFG